MRPHVSKLQLTADSLAMLVLAGKLAIWYAIFRPIQIADRAYEEGRWSQAIQVGKSYLDKHPNSKQAQLVVARSYLKMGRWEKAKQYFAELEKLDREDIQARAFGLGRLGR